MDELWNQRTRPSALVDLGPLPEVVESNSETTWKMFMQLQAQHSASFSSTTPSALAALGEHAASRGGTLSVDALMAEARRYNRICPVEAQWVRLHALLFTAGGTDGPPPLTGPEFRRAPSLAKRMRLREQIEWSATRGLLPDMYEFLTALPEDQWVHMGD